MEQIKVSQLNEVSNINNSDVIPIVHSNDTYKVSIAQLIDIFGTEVDLTNYLAKNNTTAYTPTGNYNPSTKKYVDDILASLEVGVIERLRDLTSLDIDNVMVVSSLPQTQQEGTLYLVGEE